MQGTLSLNGTWSLAHNDDFPRFLTAETLPGRFTLPARVPAPIHQVLMDAGMLDDPRYGRNSLKARWVEECYWAYRRTFTPAPEYIAGTPSWLVFERLEMDAVIYLNGQEIGRHSNAHRPARFDVTQWLRPEGENVLVVLIDAGLFDVSEKPGIDYRDSPQARLTKIHWHRRGQWQRGWDWQQRLLNVGILGDVRLEWSDQPIVEQWKVFATVSDDLQTATYHARASVLNPTDRPVTTTIHMDADGLFAEETALLPPGRSDIAVRVDQDNPPLWWPIGHGPQNRVGVHVQLTTETGFSGEVTRFVGVRK
ncbi:MAG: hypothetical protein SFU56_11870, partial [Capsulimonadales bacterium]|nr:hypothetical protein [Capsulimonadales bacterium]